MKLLRDVFQETYRVLVCGGRVCINVANLGRKPYIPLTSYINQIMFEIGFLMRGEIIWNKASSSGGSCAWGSWKSASNPTLRDVHEYILVYSKDKLGKEEKKGIRKNKPYCYSGKPWKKRAVLSQNLNLTVTQLI